MRRKGIGGLGRTRVIRATYGGRMGTTITDATIDTTSTDTTSTDTTSTDTRGELDP
jgi:hypothetical protein